MTLSLALESVGLESVGLESVGLVSLIGGLFLLEVKRPFGGIAVAHGKLGERFPGVSPLGDGSVDREDRLGDGPLGSFVAELATDHLVIIIDGQGGGDRVEGLEDLLQARGSVGRGDAHDGCVGLEPPLEIWSG